MLKLFNCFKKKQTIKEEKSTQKEVINKITISKEPKKSQPLFTNQTEQTNIQRIFNNKKEQDFKGDDLYKEIFDLLDKHYN